MSTLLTRATSAPAPAQPASLSEALLGVLHRFRAGLEAEAELDASPELDAGTLQRTFDVACLAL